MTNGFKIVAVVLDTFCDVNSSIPDRSLADRQGCIENTCRITRTDRANYQYFTTLF